MSVEVRESKVAALVNGFRPGRVRAELRENLNGPSTLSAVKAVAVLVGRVFIGVLGAILGFLPYLAYQTYQSFKRPVLAPPAQFFRDEMPLDLSALPPDDEDEQLSAGALDAGVPERPLSLEQKLAMTRQRGIGKAAAREAAERALDRTYVRAMQRPGEDEEEVFHRAPIEAGALVREEAPHASLVSVRVPELPDASQAVFRPVAEGCAGPVQVVMPLSVEAGSEAPRGLSVEERVSRNERRVHFAAEPIILGEEAQVPAVSPERAREPEAVVEGARWADVVKNGVDARPASAGEAAAREEGRLAAILAAEAARAAERAAQADAMRVEREARERAANERVSCKTLFGRKSASVFSNRLRPKRLCRFANNEIGFAIMERASRLQAVSYKPPASSVDGSRAAPSSDAELSEAVPVAAPVAVAPSRVSTGVKMAAVFGASVLVAALVAAHRLFGVRSNPADAYKTVFILYGEHEQGTCSSLFPISMPK